MLNALIRWWDTRQHGPVVWHSYSLDGWLRRHEDGFERRCGPPPRPKPDPRWAAKQKLAAPARYYGNGGTIHASTDLDVETHHGTVVAVWFRCQPLPFRQHEVDAQRATDMERMSHDTAMPKLTGVEVLDPPPVDDRPKPLTP